MGLSAKGRKRLNIALIVVLVVVPVVATIVLALALTGHFDQKTPNVCPVEVAVTQPDPNPAFTAFEPAETPIYCK